MHAIAILLALSLQDRPAADRPAPVERAAPAEAAPPSDLVSEIDAIVRRDFMTPGRLGALGWDQALVAARGLLARAPDEATRHKALDDLLATLRTSHTGYFPREDPAYWDLASIFEGALARRCRPERLPPLPITAEAIGVFWRRIEGRWFVGGLFAGGPAERAGLLTGDEVLSADGQPFGPVRAFDGKAGTPVRLEVRRSAGAAPVAVKVTPERARPVEALRQAVVDSYRVVERRGRRVATLRIWAWLGDDFQSAVLDGLTRANAERVDGYVLDLRDGWGGARPHYLSIFMKEVPTLERVGRDGAIERFDAQVRKPAVVLVNGGTRSGKEGVAQAIRKHGLARLVGERTAGAVVFGSPSCLSDGALLLLAVDDARVDGERLEGVGVPPDVEVRWDLRHAAGHDPQLERALDLLAP